MKLKKIISFFLLIVPISTGDASHANAPVHTIDPTQYFNQWDYRHNLDFIDKLGYVESGNRYHVQNKSRHMGRYQFSLATLRHLGYKGTREQFMSTPEIQDEYIVKLMKYNKRVLRRYIDRYDNTRIHGVYVTESGMLAAAHLGGAGSVIRFIKHGHDFADGNGTNITKYMRTFQNYSILL